jgi:hypothetical protein
MLNVLLITIGLILGIVLESFLSAFCTFSFIFFVILFVYRKLNWKIIIAFVIVITMILDVVNHFVLGSSLAVYGISFIIFEILSAFFPEDDSVFGSIPVLISVWIFYILTAFLPYLISFGEWRGLSLQSIFRSLLFAVFTILLIWLFEMIVGRIRGDKLNSKIRLK